jgi:4-amino-4-deoxy-L-arabinose transferase-like glycosyltransferase
MAAGATALLVATSWLYGYHRDELYYLWGGEHLAWGFVDHPPLVPLVARIVDTVDGHSVVGLRVVAALIAGWLVVAGALIARELGGSRRAQIIAAFAILCLPAARGPEALYGTTAADAAVWAVVLLLFVRLLRTERPRQWLWIGVATGVGLETKWTVLVLLAGLAIGLLATPKRRLLWSPWTLAGGAIALAAWLPNLIWNATHDWPFLEFQRNLAQNNGHLDQRLLFVPLLVLLGGLVTIVVWLPGWRWLFADDRFRALAIAAVAMTLLVLATGGKPYYVSPVFVALLAAGAIVLDRATERWRRNVLWVLAINALITLPLTMPLLPAGAVGWVKPINPELGEMVGWPDLVATTRTAFESLPASERAHTIVLADNYGTASALLRDAPDLPTYVPHNSLWYEGPPPDGTTTVLTVGRRASTLTWCGSIEPAGTITNADDVPNMESGRPLLVCRQLTEPWSHLWNELKAFD